jgi:hypothetical protein
MSLNRRKFLENAALSAAAIKSLSCLPSFAQLNSAASKQKAYGSGHFGHWTEDEFGLPAFAYTCDQTKDPKAVTEVNPHGILSSTEHIHQVGNDRIVAIASNYGHVRVRQDEGAPKFLNDHAPERGIYAGGVGYLSDGKQVMSTSYAGGSNFERVFGVGYFRKRISSTQYKLDQVIFAPFGDDPVLVSQVTIANMTSGIANLRWIEYWGCQLYQFSFRSFMESFGDKSMHDLRREFGARFEHQFKSVSDRSALLNRNSFPGRDPNEERQFQKMLSSVEENSNPFLAPLSKDVPKNASFDDLNPPPTFLASLDAPPDSMSSNAKDFFGSSGVEHPTGIPRPLDGNLEKSGTDAGFLLERKLSLNPGESRTLTFLYGYVPSGFDLDGLITRYRQTAPTALRDSSAEWKKHGLRFSTESEPWVEREVTWNHYYLRSGITYDDFFHQHIISQASIYQYVMGFQGAARDPLQHALPLLFGDPDLVKEVLRYTLKEIRPDGSIPYGIVGHGMIMPTVSDNSSDMPLWLIWAVCEYILATRDVRFLDSEVVTAYGSDPNAVRGEGAGRDTVRNLLLRCYKYLTQDVKTGEHGLMRMLQDDWNDALVRAWVPQSDVKECVQKGESVVNSAMAAYVFEYYARMLGYAGDGEHVIAPIRVIAEQHRAAVRGQWTGKWFKRAWLGPANGWVGEKCMWMEPQPWALISRITDEQQTKTLVQSIDQELRRPSPIGAFQLTPGPDQETHGEWKTEPGTSVNGGVWPSLNQTLIWALAGVNGEMAWDEWKKNSFARHAETYPDVWYGTWSGPDVLNSVNSKRPGETTAGARFGWTDFPVLNMHAHACSLYSLAKLLGLEFFEAGVIWTPRIPLATFRFESLLLGLIKSASGYEGWYNPTAQNTWSVRLRLTSEEAKQFSRVEANGERVHRPRAKDNAIEMRGTGGNGKAFKWSVSRG